MILALLVIFSAKTFGGGLPGSIDVTEANISEIGLIVEEDVSGSESDRIFYVHFPQEYGNCPAGRVQTALFDTDQNEITSSSMDYKVLSGTPSVLVHFDKEKYDMGFSVQYCCSEGKAPGCKLALFINSLEESAAW